MDFGHIVGLSQHNQDNNEDHLYLNLFYTIIFLVLYYVNTPSRLVGHLVGMTADMQYSAITEISFRDTQYIYVYLFKNVQVFKRIYFGLAHILAYY